MEGDDIRIYGVYYFDKFCVAFLEPRQYNLE